MPYDADSTKADVISCLLEYGIRLRFVNGMLFLGLLQVGAAHHVPGTLHTGPGHAVLCGGVPGTFSAPDVK
jgi:hypothetical protein